ncbi:ANTAR domain-containing response regulator [Stutzerimonas stutzeri]|jgi:AmiR/NasT family two-component response regulator|uniref:ANTAR domain-containing response regulator n=1 Tax=Pseudomonadaceae TaxID=135621 RepID=UPI000FD55979|nr:MULTISPECIES: ANTAR domain-containing protein [Pseudomonadaceae]RUI10425.1 ANTAR domain-containing protein [Pseudomonas aeruginosa]UIP31954.1 ANTAR domain-containing protein [Stutzerimonas kunmingensis]
MTLRAGKKRRFAQGSEPTPLNTLRELTVLAIHPDNEDGQNLTEQLQRIGCQVRTQWPIPDRAPAETDLIILAVTPETLSINAPWLFKRTIPILPVIRFENPIIIEALQQLGAFAVIPAPVRSFGVLASIVLTLNQAQNARDREKHVKRLEARLAVNRTIQNAKNILIETQGLSEREAYNALRDQAMAKREPVEKIAEALIKARSFFIK